VIPWNDLTVQNKTRSLSSDDSPSQR